MQISMEDVVRACYRSLLMREADADGLQQYLHLLSTGAMDVTDLLSSFLTSPEYMSARTGGLQMDAAKLPTKLTNDQSQFGEFGLLLERWTNENARHRLIVDVGARGRERSNSYDLMRYFRWKAVLVEANPALIDQIKRDFSGLNFELVNVAVSDYDGTATFHIGVNDDVSSLNAEAALTWGSVARTIEVPVRRIGGLLSERSIPIDFDLLSIDIEGEDVRVLEDLIRNTPYRPRWIIIEASHDYKTKSLEDLHVSADIISSYEISGQTAANLILKYIGD